MRLISYFLSFIPLVLIFLSCTEEKESSVLHLKVPVNQTQKAKTSDFIADFKAVKLEFTDKSMLHSVRKIIKHNGLIYVLDTFGAKCVLVYDMNGKFIRNIGSMGRGPGQFALPQDFLIDPNTNEIEIISNRKINYYSMNGEYLRQIEIGFSGINFRKIGKDYIIAAIGREEHKVFCTDEKGNIKERYLPTNSNYERGVAFNCFVSYSPEILLFRSRNRDTIYSVNTSNAFPHALIDYGDYKLKLDEFLSLDRSQRAMFYKGETNINQCMTNVYYENVDYVQVVYNMSGTYYYFIQNKKTGNLLHFAKNEIEDDVIGQNDSWGFYGGDDEYFYYSVEPYRFKSTKQLRTFYEKFTHDEEFINEMILETSNPILLFVKYKL